MFDELLENMFDELKEVKYFEEITAFRMKYFEEITAFKNVIT